MTMAGIAIGGVMFATVGRMPTLCSARWSRRPATCSTPISPQGRRSIDFAILRMFGAEGDLRMARLLVAISGENIAGGIAGAAFVAYLSAITSREYSAVQYALLSSLTFLIGSLGRAALGGAIDEIGYAPVFRFTAADRPRRGDILHLRMDQAQPPAEAREGTVSDRCDTGRGDLKAEPPGAQRQRPGALLLARMLEAEGERAGACALYADVGVRLPGAEAQCREAGLLLGLGRRAEAIAPLAEVENGRSASTGRSGPGMRRCTAGRPRPWPNCAPRGWARPAAPRSPRAPRRPDRASP